MPGRKGKTLDIDVEIATKSKWVGYSYFDLIILFLRIKTFIFSNLKLLHETISTFSFFTSFFCK